VPNERQLYSAVAVQVRQIDMTCHINSALIVQFGKFSFSGVFLTAFYAVIYLPLSSHMAPLTAHFVAYGFAIALGFFINRFWSFRGYGGKNGLMSSATRFSIVSLLGLALNSLFVWGLTSPPVNGPNWWPLVPIVLVTPMVTFLFNRIWAFS